MRQTAQQIFKGSNPFTKKRRDRQEDSVHVGTSRNSRRDPKLKNANPISIPVPNNTTYDSVIPNTVRNTRVVDRMNSSSASRGRQKVAKDVDGSINISNNTHSTSKTIPTPSSNRDQFPGLRRRKSKDSEVIEISDDEAASSNRDTPKNETRRRLRQRDSEDDIVSVGEPSPPRLGSPMGWNSPALDPLTGLSPPKPMFNYPSKFSPKPVVSQELDVDIFTQEYPYATLITKNTLEHKSCERTNESKSRSEEDDLGPLFEPVQFQSESPKPVKLESTKEDDLDQAFEDVLSYGKEEKNVTILESCRKRKRTLQDEDSNNKAQKSKIEDEHVTSPIHSPSPVLPYDPIDDYNVEPVGPDEHLLTYPFTGKDSVVVYERDMDRLEDETYLNDTLLDVFPKIWADEFPSASVHTFSSFFYTKLMGEEHDAFNYDNVERWTKDVDIFQKKLLIMPINQKNHWYILIVTNPGYCVQGHTNHAKEESSINRSSRNARNKTIYAGTTLNPQKSYIMMLDPLNLTRNDTANNLKLYLKKEAMKKLELDEDEFVMPEVVKTPCPIQKNFTDCGVYCLHFVRSFFKNPDTMLSTLHANKKNSPDWDMEGTLPVFRNLLRRTLKSKMKEYREFLLSSLDDL